MLPLCQQALDRQGRRPDRGPRRWPGRRARPPRGTVRSRRPLRRTRQPRRGARTPPRLSRAYTRPERAGGAGKPTPPLTAVAELRDRETVALSDDPAARDLRLVGHQRLELLVVDPGVDKLARLLALLRGLEETE